MEKFKAYLIVYTMRNIYNKVQSYLGIEKASCC